MVGILRPGQRGGYVHANLHGAGSFSSIRLGAGFPPQVR